VDAPAAQRGAAYQTGTILDVLTAMAPSLVSFVLDRLRYRLVDVFTERPFAGNPLCVVLDRCPSELMQPIAREVNLSETTFPLQTGDDSYEMRIFSPTVELPFAGHPSIGTAWVLGPRRWTQVTSGATVTVEADEQGARMTQPVPEFEALDEQSEPLLSALGLRTAAEIRRSTGGGTTHVLVATSEPIDTLDPDLTQVADVSRRCRSHTLVPMRMIDRSRLHARVFAPAAGVPEDPGSGSAAGPIALLARELWGADAQVTITMGAEKQRPSQIEVELTDEIRVGGRVTISAEGEFLI
jgi:trans-2,3-dihydro-3-hydroxyanthranilate isomerase